MNLFLQSAPVLDGIAGGAIAGGLMAFIMAFIGIIIVFSLIIYIYMSLAFMAIGKKTNYPSPGLAWIPMVGPALIASKTANMHWWPILLLIGMVIPFIGGLASLAFTVFFIIWMWKTFEAVGRPGWWAIFQIIPILNIVWFVFIGIAAWGNAESSVPVKTAKAIK